MEEKISRHSTMYNIHNVQHAIKHYQIYNDAGKYNPYTEEKSVHRNGPRNDSGGRISKDLQIAVINSLSDLKEI